MPWHEIRQIIRDWDVGFLAVFALLTNYMDIWSFTKSSAYWRKNAQESLDLLKTMGQSVAKLETVLTLQERTISDMREEIRRQGDWISRLSNGRAGNQ